MGSITEFDQITERMRRFLDDTFTGSRLPMGLQSGWSPLVDVKETEESYRVALPEPSDAGAVDATLSDGVLTVRVPKSQRTERRKIAIK